MKKYFFVSAAILCGACLAFGATQMSDILVDANGYCSQVVRYIQSQYFANGFYINSSAVWEYSSHAPIQFGSGGNVNSADTSATVNSIVVQSDTTGKAYKKSLPTIDPVTGSIDLPANATITRGSVTSPAAVGLGNVQNIDQTNAANITTGTIDGDRLPAISTTKKSGVPAVPSASGKFLKDDGTWATPSATSGVSTVNTRSGDVTLAKTDVGLGNVENTALSTWAGTSNVTTLGTLANNLNVASGKSYLINASQALGEYEPLATTGSMMVGNGGGTLQNSTGNEGFYNFFAGYMTGYHATKVNAATSVGSYAGGLGTINDRCTNVGASAGYTGTTNTDNTYVGYAAGWKPLGSYNTAVGANAMSAATSASGQYNCALGYNSLTSVSSGGYNVCLGAKAGDSITTGGSSSSNGNVVIGYNSDVSAASGNNQIVIGSGVTGTGDNEVIIGNSNHTKFTLGNSYFVLNANTSLTSMAFTATENSGIMLYVDSNTGHVGRQMVCTRMAKENIRPLEIDSSKLMGLDVYSYNYKKDYADGKGAESYGFMAEDIEAAVPGLTTYSPYNSVFKDSKETKMIPTGFRLEKFTILLFNEVKKQKKKIDDLEARLKKLEEKLGE